IPLIAQLAREGVKLNITAVLTPRQVKAVAAALDPIVPAIVSVLAGRIADTGVDPLPIMTKSVKIVSDLPKVELLWASVREVLNVFQAAACGCSIVTVPYDLLINFDELDGKYIDILSLIIVYIFYYDFYYM